MEFLLLSGISLGLSASLLPGPLQTYLIQLTLSLGWRRSIVAVLSPLIADIPVIILMVFILSQFPADITRWLQIVGGFFVLWLAWSTWRQLRAGLLLGAESGTLELTPRQVLARMVGVNLLSPGPYIFWSTVNGPLLIQAYRQSTLHAAGFLVGFYGTFLGMLSLYVLVFDRVRRLDRRVTQLLLLITVIALVFLGLSLIGQGFGLIG
jgi:threonine/homoserine/homoserine lactone efflux protein